MSEVKLVCRTKVKASERLQINCSKGAYEIFMVSWDADSIEYVEEFKVVLLIMDLYNKKMFNLNSKVYCQSVRNVWKWFEVCD